jgi:hypothetical protein
MGGRFPASLGPKRGQPVVPLKIITITCRSIGALLTEPPDTWASAAAAARLLLSRTCWRKHRT